jgi:hypothetical protein
MSGAAGKVEAFEPEANPANIDTEALRDRGWPKELVECVKEQRSASNVLKQFERQSSAGAGS